MKRNQYPNTLIVILAVCTAFLTASGMAGAADGSEDDFEEFRRTDYFPSLSPSHLTFGTVTADDGWQADISKDLLPRAGSRAWRSATLDFVWLDQPDNIVFVTRDQMTMMETVQSFANPESRLRRLGLTVSPGRWFRSAADFSAAYGTATAKGTKGLVDAMTDPLAGLANLDDERTDKKRTKLDYLSWTGKGGFGKRFASALRLVLNQSDRPRVSGPRMLPEFNDDAHATTFSLRFDPDAVVLFPGDLAAAYAALDSHTSLAPRNSSGLTKKTACKSTDSAISCLNHLTGKKIKGRSLAGALPTVEIKREDQFDFLALGGSFVHSSLIEDSIDTITFTWDLGVALNGASHRRDAVKAIALHHKLVKRDEMREDALIVEMIPRI